MKRIFEINPWKVITHTFNEEDKRLQESMTSTGNEYMGMRGMFEEKYSGDTHKGIYLGGVWFPDKTRVGWWKNGYPEYFGKVINAVDFVSVDVKLDGESVDLAKDEFSDFELALDMKSGILTRSYVVKRGEKKVKLNFERFISVDMKELYADRITVENLSSASVEVEIESSIDADVFNEDSNYDEKFWNVLSKKKDQTTGRLVAETIENNFGTPQFTTEMLMANVSDLDAKEPVETDLKVSNVFAGTLEAGKKTVFEKRVVVVTSRDYATLEDLDAAGEKLSAKQAESSFDELKAAQANGWAKRWEKADVVVEGNDESQQGIRFNLFQLFSTYYGNDARLNIGPKGFTGEKYGGATYWDTEGFAVPLYLALADQSVTRNLLEYRHEQLPGAYHNAKQQGLDGALFPMVTFNGIECHNEWEITFEEIHRNGTIAYAIYNYTRYTGDTEYVTHDGFDVLVGIARFWADRVHFSKRKGMYMIHGVTGPNEYENNVNNNWYTNILAKWCLNYANEIADKVDADKTAELGLTSEERAKWHEIADNMYLPEDKELGIFVQHDTFLDKDLTPVKDLPQDQLPLNQHWSWDHKEDKAFEMYSRTARLDLDNYNNDTNDGLHITSMTGSWLAIVQGFAGMRVIDDELQFAPFLPKEWTGYKFRINFRGRLLSISVSQEGTQIDLLKGDDLTIKLNGKDLKLTAK